MNEMYFHQCDVDHFYLLGKIKIENISLNEDLINELLH